MPGPPSASRFDTVPEPMMAPPIKGRVLTACEISVGKSNVMSTPALGRPNGEAEPAVDPSRFLPPDHERAPGHWLAKPDLWPEERLLADETRGVVEAAIERLPPAQRAVISLRDLDGWSAEETRNALELTETNQRVLLHRARSKVRQALEDYFRETE